MFFALSRLLPVFSELYESVKSGQEAKRSLVSRPDFHASNKSLIAFFFFFFWWGPLPAI